MNLVREYYTWNRIICTNLFLSTINIFFYIIITSGWISWTLCFSPEDSSVIFIVSADCLPFCLAWCCDQYAWAAKTLSRSSWGTGSPLLCWGEILAVCTNVFHLSCQKTNMKKSTKNIWSNQYKHYICCDKQNNHNIHSILEGIEAKIPYSGTIPNNSTKREISLSKGSRHNVTTPPIFDGWS